MHFILCCCRFVEVKSMFFTEFALLARFYFLDSSPKRPARSPF
ncbi:hypothetical protein DAI22_01g247000 [Oryza sativa Japonica Group]|nr:hypothetical protein DAI22_01g247000 [Oryza sativa Japonica Group]